MDGMLKMKILNDALFVVYITGIVWVTWGVLNLIASIAFTYFYILP